MRVTETRSLTADCPVTAHYSALHDVTQVREALRVVQGLSTWSPYDGRSAELVTWRWSTIFSSCNVQQETRGWTKVSRKLCRPSAHGWSGIDLKHDVGSLKLTMTTGNRWVILWKCWNHLYSWNVNWKFNSKSRFFSPQLLLTPSLSICYIILNCSGNTPTH